MATKHFAIVDEDPGAEPAMKDMNAALLASAEGDWTKADTMLRKILEKDAENFVVCVEKLWLSRTLISGL